MESENLDFLYKVFGVGLTGYDILLLIMCPFCGMLGTMVANAVKGILNKPVFEALTELPPYMRAKFESHGSPDADAKQYLAEINRDMKSWHNKRVRQSEMMDSFRLPFIGLVLGFVVALYFLGAITNDLTSLARVLGLCILLGYQAPNIWFTQEKAIKKALDEKIDTIISETGLTSSSKGRS